MDVKLRIENSRYLQFQSGEIDAVCIICVDESDIWFIFCLVYKRRSKQIEAVRSAYRQKKVIPINWLVPWLQLQRAIILFIEFNFEWI